KGPRTRTQIYGRNRPSKGQGGPRSCQGRRGDLRGGIYTQRGNTVKASKAVQNAMQAELTSLVGEGKLSPEDGRHLICQLTPRLAELERAVRRGDDTLVLATVPERTLQLRF